MPKQRLTVVQMIPNLESGGVERGTVELNEELVRQGHRSIVISGGGRLVEEITRAGGEHIQWKIGVKSPSVLKYIWPLQSLLKREKVDVLHLASRIPAWVGWLAWKGMWGRNRPRLVTSAHALYRVNRFSAIMASGERVIAISETVGNYLRQNYPRLDHDVIRIVPRGIDPEEFPRGYQPSSEWLDAWYSSYPHLMGKPVISLVGRMTRLKGHHDLVEIVEKLKPSVPDIQALIVGGVDPRREEYAAELRELVRVKGLEGNVTFTGHRRDIREIYAVSNVILSLTSDPPEGFGRTTVEALNMGTPVVGYDHGGTGEILHKVFPPGVVPPGNTTAAAEAIHQILTRGAQIPEDHPYMKERMLAQTLDVYREVAA
ncbi:glycosyltransferase family 4 protein [Planctomicrobium sp. SH661]|uniref:glycosyltransferase family 4 protein n=1 Tax=Planctomicrobium sp. SH661 TaxID=3448124 RepID=UPI003F5B89FC